MSSTGHKILEKAEMPDGTKIQIEDWKSVYPDVFETMSIAAYPKAKHDKGTWIRRGETFRLDLAKGFKNDLVVMELFMDLIHGKKKLEDLDKHYWNGDKDRYVMGLTDERP